MARDPVVRLERRGFLQGSTGLVGIRLLTGYGLPSRQRSIEMLLWGLVP